MADQSQKTEQATPQRLKKARQEGRFPTARTFVSAVSFLAFVALLGSLGPEWIRSLQIGMAEILQKALDPRLQPQELIALCLEMAKNSLLPLAFLGGILMAITFSAQMITTGLGVSLKKL